MDCKRTIGRIIVAALALAPVACDDHGVGVPAAAAQGPTIQEGKAMKITLRVNDKILTATLIDSPTARDFASLLPLTLTMKDLFDREKYARLPREISDRGERRTTYEVGQLVYWSPGPDVAIYYRQDGERIPEPGVIVIGKIDAGIDELLLKGPAKVRMELATDNQVEAEGTQGGKMEIKHRDSQPPTRGPAEYFTGTVHVEPLFQAVAPGRAAGASVTFEPGARSAWHTHPLGQTLIVTAGSGYVQSWGGPVRRIKEGDVITCPPGQKHWHGADATTSMTHLAIQEGLDGKMVEWMEKVNDEEYKAAGETK
jgi:quercetin dioxygenase-like cupin family protein